MDDERLSDDYANRCGRCGYTFRQTRDSYERFQMADVEDLECPMCDHHKKFGILHSE